MKFSVLRKELNKFQPRVYLATTGWCPDETEWVEQFRTGLYKCKCCASLRRLDQLNIIRQIR